jgi:hypothetical protein
MFEWLTYRKIKQSCLQIWNVSGCYVLCTMNYFLGRALTISGISDTIYKFPQNKLEPLVVLYTAAAPSSKWYETLLVLACTENLLDPEASSAWKESANNARYQNRESDDSYRCPRASKTWYFYVRYSMEKIHGPEVRRSEGNSKLLAGMRFLPPIQLKN